MTQKELNCKIIDLAILKRNFEKTRSQLILSKIERLEMDIHRAKMLKLIKN